jgi:hypothetical protein
MLFTYFYNSILVSYAYNLRVIAYSSYSFKVASKRLGIVAAASTIVRSVT